jgi:FAD synthetase
MSSSQCTAGIIIIGDEITKGKVADINSHYIAQKLYALGVDVHKISIIPDQMDVIAEEVALFSKKFTHVVTAGGIGPTHDDITYQAIAHGLQQRLILLPELVELIKAHFKIPTPLDYDPLNPPTFPCDVETSSFNPALKMALVPASSQLHHAVGLSVFPMVQVNNVYVMPGIPQYMKRCCRHLETLARNPDRTFLSSEIYMQADEVRLAPILNASVKEFGSHVSFGSYPVIGHSYYRTKLTMESTDPAKLDAAHQHLSAELPADCNVPYDPKAIERAPEVVQDIIAGKGVHHRELQVPISNAYQVTTEFLFFLFYNIWKP